MSTSGDARIARLRSIATAAREHVIRMTEGGGCFLGASLSCVDLFVSMYADGLRLSPDRLDDPDRDTVLLSKGHAVPALYATLTELGYFPAERLKAHLTTRDDIYWHPNRAIPGVEFHSGSLGHMLSVGIGIALDARIRRSAARVFVVVGDGELNEGSIWEGLLVARAQRLGSLVLVVDRNRLQANSPTEDLIPLEPLADKFEAFGWNVSTVDGHSFDELRNAFNPVPSQRPTVVIANTVRGKGIAELEGRVDGWFIKGTVQDIANMISSLRDSVALPAYAE